MSTIVEAVNYDASVYSLDVTDPALGGSGGPLNKAAQNLANRTAFLLSQVKNLTSGQTIYGIDTGTAAAYAATYSPVTPALVDGLVRRFKAAHQNAGAATFEPDGLPVLPIYGGNHQPLKGGEIVATGVVSVELNLSLNAGAGAWVITESTGAAQQLGAGSYGVTVAADDSSQSLATTAWALGQLSATAPGMDGVAAIGTSKRFARADHVHPTDTTRAAITSPTFLVSASGPTPAADDNTTKLATTAWTLGQVSATPPGMNGAAAVGVSTRFARSDHVHPTDTTRAPLVGPNFSAATFADLTTFAVRPKFGANTPWDSGNLANLSQLLNTPGFLTVANFPALAASNGFIQLVPGIILQWMSATMNSTFNTQNWPHAFPTAIFTLNANMAGGFAAWAAAGNSANTAVIGTNNTGAGQATQIWGIGA